jgi:nitrite reductase/ring-hydroxylating ferredoxin subunit
VWVCAGEDEAVAEGEAIRFDPESGPAVAIFRVDGALYCVDDTCTHEESSLADGYIEGDVVECSFHFARFSIRTGAVLGLPATLPLHTYPVKVEDGKVYVELAAD